MTKIRFWYIKPYDSLFAEMYRLKQFEVQQKGLSGFENPYYTEEKVKKYMLQLKERREPKEEKVITKIEELFGSQFIKKNIICNCVGYCHVCAGFSHPLTVCVGAVKDTNTIGMTLIHELLHIKIGEENDDQHKKFKQYMIDNFAIGSNEVVLSHVLLFSVMFYVCNETGLGEICETNFNLKHGEYHQQAIDFIKSYGYEKVWQSYNDIKSGKIKV